MNKADYTYNIKGNKLSIQDLNLGNMSVTNSIEDVVEEICKKNNLDPNILEIIYRDSDGHWDGWDHLTQTFIYL